MSSKGLFKSNDEALISSKISCKTIKKVDWSLLDHIFSVLRSNDSHQKEKTKTLTSFIAALESNCQVPFESDFMTWLIYQTVDILLDKSLLDCHKDLILIFIKITKIMGAHPQLLRECISTFYDIFKKVNENEAIGSVIEPKGLELPANIANKNTQIIITNNFDITNVCFCFITFTDTCITQLSTSAPLAYQVLTILNNAMIPEQIPLQTKAMETVTHVSLVLCAPFDLEVWDIIISFVMQMYQLYRKPNATNLPKIYGSILKTMNNLITKEPQNLQKLSKMFIKMSLETLDLTIEYMEHSLIRKGNSMAILLHDIAKNISINSFNEEDIVLFLSIMKKEQYFYLIIKEFLVHIVESKMPKETEDVKIINVRDVSYLWDKLCSILEDFFDSDSYLVEENILMCSEILKMGYQLENQFKSCTNAKMIFFDARVRNSMANITKIIQKCSSFFNVSECRAVTLLLLRSWDLIADRVERFDYILLLLLLPWHSEKFFTDKDAVSEVKDICLDALLQVLPSLPAKTFNKNFEALKKIFIKSIENDSKLLTKTFNILVYTYLKHETSDIFELLELLLNRGNMDLVFNNDIFGEKILCFLHSNCFLIRDGKWEVLCKQCDKVEGSPVQVNFVNLQQICSDIILGFIYRFIGTGWCYNEKMGSFFKRFFVHAPFLHENVIAEEIINTFFTKRDRISSLKFIKPIFVSDDDIKIENVSFFFATFKEKIEESKHLGSSFEKEQMATYLIDLAQNIVSFSVSKLLLPMLKFLIKQSESSILEQMNFHEAFFALPNVNISYINNLFIENEDDLSKWLAELLVKNPEKSKVERNLKMFALTFGFEPQQFLQSYALKYILPYIVINCHNKAAFCLFEKIGNFLDESSNDMALLHSDDIFSEVYFKTFDDPHTYNEKKRLLCFLTSCDISTLVAQYYPKFLRQIIFHTDEIEKIVCYMQELNNLGKSDDSLDFYSQNIIGLMAAVDSQLTASAPKFIVRHHIKAVSTFIKILGPSIVTNLRIKLLATLRNGVSPHFDSMPYECLDAWINFIYCVSLSKIAPYLSTIFGHLLPVFDKFPKDISNIFHYLVVENYQIFSEYIPDLYFFNDFPNNETMHKIYLVIQNSKENIEDCRPMINRALDHLENCNIEAREYLLKQLQHLIEENSTYLTTLALKSENLDPIFEKIVKSILDSANFNNEKTKIVSAACLGALGAIDPAKFKFHRNQVNLKNEMFNIQSEPFAAFCIGVMLKELNKYGEVKDVNVIVSSIQEMLKLFFKNRNDVQAFLEKFTINERDILEPLLYTKYIFKSPQLKRRPADKIRYGSHIGIPPCKWAYYWSCELLSFVPYSLARTIFLKCLPCIKLDLHILKAILPYIVLHVILVCRNTHLQLITTEMKSILNWDIQRERIALPNTFSLEKDIFSHLKPVHSANVQATYQSIVLDLLDFLNKAYIDIAIHGTNIGINKKEQRLTKLNDFLSSFSKMGLSLKSFMQKDYYRCLYYAEKSWAEDNNANLLALENAYAKLNDRDGLLGIEKCKTNTHSPEENMQSHQISGTTQDAMAIYEALGSKYNSTNMYRVLLQCYLSINQPTIAKRLSKQLFEEKFYLEPTIYNEHFEALWKTNSYDELDSLLVRLHPKMTENWLWNIDKIESLKQLKKLKIDGVTKKINSIRCHLINRLSQVNNTGIGLYRQGYSFVVKLHLLSELGSFASCISNPNQDYNIYFNNMALRFDVLPQNSTYAQEILDFRQQCLSVGLNLNKYQNIFKNELGQLWLKNIKIERKNQNFSTTYSNICIAEKYSPAELFIEKAKYHKAKNQIDVAIHTLKRGISSLETRDKNLAFINAKARLLVARYESDSMNVDFKEGYNCFQEAASLLNLEKSFVYLGQYLYKQLPENPSTPDFFSKRHIQYNACLNFSKSLTFGNKYIYQSLPCLLSLWLDYGAKYGSYFVQNQNSSERGAAQQIMEKFNLLMENNNICLPTYYFLTAFTQILSRVNHQYEPCFNILKKIIFNIINEYPQQSLWSVVQYSKSNHQIQKKRMELVTKSFHKSPDIMSIIKVFDYLSTIMIQLTQKPVGNVYKLKINMISPKLKILLKDSKVKVMMPSHKFCNIVVPNYRYCNSVEARFEHNPFPLDMVYMVDVKDDVFVLHSVQKPKRVTFIGSDGNSYPLLFKNYDDLRLDSRIMGFNSVVNLYLQRNGRSKERGLGIRNYNVVPLSCNSGLIEWLPDLHTIRTTIRDTYAHYEIREISLLELKEQLSTPREASIDEKLKLFEEIILPRHPPIFHKWFFQRFPMPNVWYKARENYTKTCAVMSIVGYILGLGDRHGENILIDVTNGEVVHVDFNCLFNKGETFNYPETVPFRLTHNMVMAMGPTGVEGAFVKCCEITNQVLRDNAEQLLSFIKPFLYDIDKLKNRNEVHEAQLNIANVQKRLQGVVRTKNTFRLPAQHSQPLSVEGQVRYLIQEATNKKNLCQLYFGWGAFL